ncbi:MAG: sulfite exporter TauE/SafE family protein [Mariprofundaceae bacterium]|nr:sulfite exporter TauE/SafE family protein [Mariprofundaceae bacterium]
MSLSLWLAAPLIGLVLSLFAAGGGMIAVPLLSFGMGMPLKQAIATSLIIVACVSLVALLQKKRWQLIEWRLHRFFAIGGMLGGFLGASIGLHMADKIQAIIFAVLVLMVVWSMNSGLMQKISANAKTTPCDCRYSMLAGLATGLITGLLGIGGGFLIVPLLLMLGVANYQSVIAHSLALIISSSLVAALRYAENLDIAWQPTLLIVALAAVGAWLGSQIAGKYSSGRLQKAFSLVLTIMAGWMLFREFSWVLDIGN